MGEVAHVNGLADEAASGKHGPTKIAAAIVGHADLKLGDRVAPVLEAMQVASPRFRGIRHGLTWDTGNAAKFGRRVVPQHQALDPTFRKGFARVNQSKPKRFCPTPPSLSTTLGHAATAAMPRRQSASTSLSRLA